MNIIMMIMVLALISAMGLIMWQKAVICQLQNKLKKLQEEQPPKC
jgi:hypothetical protein